MTESAHASQDIVGGFRPHKGLGMAIRQADVRSDGLFELSRASMDTAAQLLVREGRKPALHEIDPRGAGRGEVKMHARVPEQPAVDPRGLVRARIVENEMHVQAGGHGGVNRVQELAELDRPLTTMKFAEDLAALG